MSRSRLMKPQVRRKTYTHDRDQWTFCESAHKPGYSSRQKAKRASIDFRERTDKLLRPYRCPDCEAWHLTSQAAS